GCCVASRIPRPLTEGERFCGGQGGRRLAERRRTGQAPYPAPVEEHYITPSPATDDRRHPLRVRLAAQDLALVPSASVFTRQGLGKAAAVLHARLDEVTEPPADGDILDLGCGWGPIALTAALLHAEARVWAVDVSKRARALTAEN